MQNSAIYIDGHRANVRYDARVDMMRGVFIDTHGAACFMAADVKELKVAARDALAGYVRDCNRAGVQPFRRRRHLLPLAMPLLRLKALIH